MKNLISDKTLKETKNIDELFAKIAFVNDGGINRRINGFENHLAFFGTYNDFKGHLKDKYPDLSQSDILFLFKNRDAIKEAYQWRDFYEFFIFIEFEQRKKPWWKKLLELRVKLYYKN